MKDGVTATLQAKLDRAKEHIEQFKRESVAFLDEAPQRTLIGDDPKAAEAFRALLRDRPIPVRLPILTGEAIQQIRSCLDYLICALIVRDAGEPNSRSQFPICLYTPTKKDELARYARQIEGIKRHAVRAIIERHQPHKFGRLRRTHALSILKDFSNRDKHRSLLLHVVWAQRRLDLIVDSSTPSGFDESEKPPVRMLMNGKPIKVVDMKTGLTAQIGFEQWGGTKFNMEVALGVRMLGDSVVAIINELTPLFS